VDIEMAKRIYNMLDTKSYLTEEEEHMLIDAEDALLENDLIDKNGNLIEE
jgi:hypothetical protein